MKSNEKIKKIVESIKFAIKKIVGFYYEPFSDIEIPKTEKKNIKKSPKIKKVKDEKLKNSGFIKQVIEYYGKKIYFSLLIILISIFIGIYLVVSLGLSYLWLSAYIITLVSFISLYSGIKVALQRKRSVIDGYLRFIKEYLIYRKDITFKTHILESKESSYPFYFAKELEKMKLNLNTKQSYIVLSEFFDDPKNNYPELLSIKNLSLSVISTKDDSIANALSEQLDYIENGRTILSSKLGFTKFFIFIVVGFIFLVQVFLTFQFSSVLSGSFSSNGGGLSLNINLVPTPINYFLLLYVGGISVLLTLIAIDIGTYDEDKIANHMLLGLIGFIILSSVIFFMGL